VTGAFSSLSLEPGFLDTLEQLGFTAPTPVQALALPPALEGRDLVVRASTGSGKTAVFALSLLSRLNRKFFGVQALVLCPTRELADQVAVEVRRLGRSIDHLKVVTLCGGVPLRGQASSLAHGAHIVVGTPGRVQDHLSRGTLTLGGLRTLVLDEADRMLDMGFVDDMVAVARLCPRDRQTLLFSATYPPGIEKIAGPFLRDPQTIEVEAASAVPKIDQRFYEVTEDNRLEVLAQALAHFRPETTLVFVNTKAQGREVVSFLKTRGLSVLELSGDLEQRDRDEVMALFAGRCVSVIVATDVASRGLDIPVLDAVVNFDISPDPEVHVHRIGRTGRAGEGGLALTLASDREKTLVRRVQEFLGLETLPWNPVAALSASSEGLPLPPRSMIKLLDGKKDKIRPGDVLGALTAAAGFHRDQVGAIKVTEWGTWVAVDRGIADQVLKLLTTVPVKGKVRRAVPVQFHQGSF
jgi:ATP-independent RNA helicase DbpA